MKYYAVAFNLMNRDEIKTNKFVEIENFVYYYGKYSNNVIIVKENNCEIYFKEVGRIIV